MTTTTTSPIGYDVAAIRRDFPILSRTVNGHPLVYLDNAATTQKPRAVIDALVVYYENENANIHRGVHSLSQSATRLYDDARHTVARFIHAADQAQVIFTRGTTESVNLVAHSFGHAFLGTGDEVILSNLEHHSNIVPWQLAAEAAGAVIRIVPMNDAGELDMAAYRGLLSPRTKLVAVNHVSNALGTVNPVEEIIRLAHEVGAKVLVDGAQWVAHHATDVQKLDADFYAFSGHKLYGPTGIGILYGKRELLEAMPPYQGGGDMIASVTFEKTTYAELPSKFEAGTPHIEGAVGLAAAIRYVESIGLDRIATHEKALLDRATAGLARVPGVRLVGTAAEKAGVLSFVVVDPPISSLDMGTRLDLRGIAVRTGHHCCQPIMDRLGVSSTTRASFALYNTEDEVDVFVTAVREIVEEARAKSAKIDIGAQITVLKYPGPTAPSVEKAAAKIEALFEFLPDWNARYQQIIDFGEKLPAMPAELKTDANFVRGCQSVVHIAAHVKPGTADVIEFLADSDADIVRGLIGILQRVYSGQRAAEVLAFDAAAFIGRLGLDKNLSMTRRNGLDAMVKRLHAVAAATT